ncbi:hypothetical protein MGALJ_60690 (plasmid) [Mycobacterium gallinarum]|uniref:Uncharacterized protein n=1 Tax=Mycobacterium gallinarum TaxID=39689 RepID=A0A9W4FIL8_9MYCO|nr:hypothetical protein MGALJ_60690 [Mycobacterium gallinarum]
MPSVNKPLDLETVAAQSLNSSGSAVAASAAADIGSSGTSAGAVCAPAGAMWAGLSAAVAENQATSEALAAHATRRIEALYRLRSEAVQHLDGIDEENRQALTLLPPGLRT